MNLKAARARIAELVLLEESAAARLTALHHIAGTVPQSPEAARLQEALNRLTTEEDHIRGSLTIAVITFYLYPERTLVEVIRNNGDRRFHEISRFHVWRYQIAIHHTKKMTGRELIQGKLFRFIEAR